MMRMLRTLAALAVGAMVAFGAQAQAPEKKKITIAVGGKNLFYYLPLSVAERQGYFKEQGLEVEIPDFAGGAKALQALVGGSADMVSGAFEHTINMAAKKQPIKAVVLQAKYSSIVLLLPKDKAAKYKGPADLKGLKVGVTAPGSSTNMFVNNILAKGGLKPTDIAVVGVGAGSGAVAAMEKGEIDAMSNLDPVITQLEATGKYVAVADSRTEKGMNEIYGGDYHASVIYITEEFIRKNPNTVQAVVNAIVRANRWIAKATPQEIVDLMPDAYKAGNPSLYKAGLLKNMIGYSEDGQMSMKAAQNVYKVLRQFEPSVIAAGNAIKLENTFDNEFAKKAAAKYR
ncbi:MAG: ABC transporter substrate-binding protein [Betaproteobacteria bacterium]|nr:ABC transporter substrate-binding protein [Betaproteobacteria bacterium]